MRVAYTRKSGGDAVVEVGMIAQYGGKSLLVGNLVFELHEKSISEYIHEAVTTGFLDIRPNSPKKELDDYDLKIWVDRG